MSDKPDLQLLAVSVARAYANIRHRRAATAWLMNGCVDRKAAEAIGVHHDTIGRWRKAENWEAWAAAKDAEAAATVEVEQAVAEAELRMIASEARMLAMTALLKVGAGMEDGTVDAMDMGAAGSLMLKAVQATDTAFGLTASRTRKVQLEADVKVASIPAEREAELAAMAAADYKRREATA